MRELTKTELDAVSGGGDMRNHETTFHFGPGSFNGNSVISVQSQNGNGNGIGNTNLNQQTNNNSISVWL